MHYHILEQGVDLKTARVAMHIAVPDVLNEAGVSYRQVLVWQKTLGGAQIQSAVPNIGAGELTQLQNGEILEVIETVRFSRLGLSKAEKKAELDAAYNNRKTDLLSEKQTELEWYGSAIDVV